MLTPLHPASPPAIPAIMSTSSPPIIHQPFPTTTPLRFRRDLNPAASYCVSQHAHSMQQAAHVGCAHVKQHHAHTMTPPTNMPRPAPAPITPWNALLPAKASFTLSTATSLSSHGQALIHPLHLACVHPPHTPTPVGTPPSAPIASSCGREARFSVQHPPPTRAHSPPLPHLHRTQPPCTQLTPDQRNPLPLLTQQQPQMARPVPTNARNEYSGTPWAYQRTQRVQQPGMGPPTQVTTQQHATAPLSSNANAPTMTFNATARNGATPSDTPRTNDDFQRNST